MTILSDRISVVGRFARSANLERDVGRVDPLDGYVVTARALDAIDRIASAAARGTAGCAWSITGPYGSGKSSLALLVDAAVGPPSSTREAAWELIDQASPAVGVRVRQAHERHKTAETGFHRAVVTANREPLNQTVLRALHVGVLRRYETIPSSSRFRAAGTLRRALEEAAKNDPRRTGPHPAALIEIARCLAEEAPLVLIIDEFGKNLEAVGDLGSADPYLLQQLAEAGQGSGLPIFVLTFQHLSYEDHLIGADDPQRREWAKVQGRFEDIAYFESPNATRALIGTVFKVNDDQLRLRIDRWAERLANEMRSFGVADLADSKRVAACYPLHPLVAMVLPELCNRYGQHERTLFSFLTSNESGSAASFLATTEIPACTPLPSLGLAEVYDYFVGTGVLAVMSARRSSRWTEITTRLRDTHGLSTKQTRLAKAVALLNLVSTTGTIRASSRTLALTDACVEHTLAALEATGVVTHREFADEYRIWQGTDVDIRRLLEDGRRQVQHQSLVELLSALDPPVPVVAARHSAEHDVLRVFTKRYVVGSERVDPISPFSPYDGEVLLVVSSDPSTPSVTWTMGGAKPIVAAVPKDVSEIDRSAREAAAVTAALKDPAVEGDRVARAELGERLAEAKSAVARAVSAAFSVASCRWVLLDGEGEIELPSGRGSAALSAAADVAYRYAPMVRNEMLNRAELTSQGAKARRLLMEAMIDHGSETDLGLTGFGPEVAMYQAFLKQTKLHCIDDRSGTMVFRRPDDHSLSYAWHVVMAEFNRAKAHRVNLNDIYAALLSPPVGMKAGVIPVFVTASLLAVGDEIAIYEHGTFKPLLTPELAERLVRNPGHFEVKHFANTTGARRQVVAALAERLGVGPRLRRSRVANVLAVVGHLVSRIKRLENYTLQTRNLSPPAVAARDALVAAIEPDTLLFHTLPEALGLPPVVAETQAYDNADAYARRIDAVLDELGGCYERLLGDLFGFLLDASAETERRAISGQATAIKDEVLNPSVRAFVLSLANDAMDTDAEWISAIATVAVQKAPTEWTDDDVLRFRTELPPQVAAFQRLVALHADQRADGGGPFRALRVTVTRADGTEHTRLIGVDASQRSQVVETLDRAIEELARTGGSINHAQSALFAIIGERLLAGPGQLEPSDTNSNIDSAEEGAMYG